MAQGHTAISVGNYDFQSIWLQLGLKLDQSTGTGINLVPAWVPPHTNWVILGRLFNSSELQFPNLQNGNNGT